MYNYYMYMYLYSICIFIYGVYSYTWGIFIYGDIWFDWFIVVRLNTSISVTRLQGFLFHKWFIKQTSLVCGQWHKLDQCQLISYTKINFWMKQVAKAQISTVKRLKSWSYKHYPFSRAIRELLLLLLLLDRKSVV